MDNPQNTKSSLSGFFTVIGIIVTVLFVLVMLGSALVSFTLRSGHNPPKAPSIVKASSNTGDSSADKNIYTFRNPDKFGDYMMLRLTAGKNNSKFSSYSYFGAGRTVNYLFINPDNGESHWLWQPPMPLVLNEYALTRPKEKVQGGSPGILALTVDKDTNADKWLSEEDKKTLVVIKPDGRSIVKLLENITQMSSVAQVDENKVLLVYEKGDKSFAATYLLKAYSITQEKELPEIVVP